MHVEGPRGAGGNAAFPDAALRPEPSRAGDEIAPSSCPACLQGSLCAPPGSLASGWAGRAALAWARHCQLTLSRMPDLGYPGKAPPRLPLLTQQHPPAPLFWGLVSCWASDGQEGVPAPVSSRVLAGSLGCARLPRPLLVHLPRARSSPGQRGRSELPGHGGGRGRGGSQPGCPWPAAPQRQESLHPGTPGEQGWAPGGLGFAAWAGGLPGLAPARPKMGSEISPEPQNRLLLASVSSAPHPSCDKRP